MPRNF